MRIAPLSGTEKKAGKDSRPGNKKRLLRPSNTFAKDLKSAYARGNEKGASRKKEKSE